MAKSLLIMLKNSNTDVLKNTSEIIVQKTAVTNGDLVSNRT